ncbi:MAG: peptidyl-prolyl cis-trans isomerase [Planctomycetes bacterium]|nr:peptidyl-prolyl cis-trans isomerase [Planctomycetota bacterium]
MVRAVLVPLCAALVLAGSAVAQTEPSVAASGRGTNLTFAEFDRLVLSRHGETETGHTALRHLLNARVLDVLAKESKLAIGDADVQKRLDQIEKDIAASGQKGGLAAYLKENGVSRATFTEYLRLGLIQETLARRALGIAEPKPVNAEQQELWLDQVMAARGVDYPAAPWTEGIAARCGDVSVSVGAFAEHLRLQLGRETLRDDCFQALLAKRLRPRLPALSDEAVEHAVDAELARRRADFAADPKHQGMTYDQAAAATGIRVESLRDDPAVRAAALAYAWVDVNWGPEGLKRVYQEERALFDGRHGEAYRVRILFLRAAVLKNQLNPRSFEDAERELGLLRAEIHDEADFKRLATTRSEDPPTRDKEGLFDWIARGDERLPADVVSRIFRDGAPIADDQRLIGPVRSTGGVVLAWVGERRAPPSWEVMASHVHRELRKRIMDEALVPADMNTFLDE